MAIDPTPSAPTPNSPLPHPPEVDPIAWECARAALLRQEKALVRLRDLVSAQRRRMPMVRVRSDYAFEGPDGRVTLPDLFGSHPQLIVQHLMFAPEWDAACSGCSMMAEHVGPLSHLAARGVAFAATSRAPLPALESFAGRMGWDLPWYSCVGDDFSVDFRALVDGEENHRISVFLRPFGDERVYLTWSTGDRGEEPFMQVFDLLDITPYGRQEDWEDSPQGWPQGPAYGWSLADEYPVVDDATDGDRQHAGPCQGHA